MTGQQPDRIAGEVTSAALLRALALGWRDFRRAPQFGLFFSGFYVICGLTLVLLGAGTFTWTLVFSTAFPLLAPFAAVGLYEVSRRLEAQQALDWREVLGVVWSERGRQLPWMGMIFLIIVLFWSFFAHMSFALFLGHMPMTNVSSSLDVLATPSGLGMVLFQLATGAAVAFLVFAISVIAMPLLMVREVDFVSAMIISIGVVRDNLAVMLLWAMLIAGLLALSMLPALLGLFITLPVLGHATWHLYRQVMG